MFLSTLAIVVACASAPAGEAATGGPEWFQGDWNALLSKARETDKPVFLDFWTDW